MSEKPTTDQIREALTKLDVADKDHWTNEGLPALDAVKAMLDGRKVTRSEVTEAAPTFNRDNPTFEVADAEKADEVDTTMTESEEFEAVKQQLEEVETQIESLRKRKLELQAEHDRLNTRLSAPKISPAENVAQYLERAFEERMARAQGVARVRDLMAATK